MYQIIEKVPKEEKVPYYLVSKSSCVLYLLLCFIPQYVESGVYYLHIYNSSNIPSDGNLDHNTLFIPVRVSHKRGEATKIYISPNIIFSEGCSIWLSSDEFKKTLVQNADLTVKRILFAEMFL